MIEFLGIGALNLDLVYEVDDLAQLAPVVDLAPGREVVCGREQIAALVELLDRKGRMVARSGGGSAANTVAVLRAMGWRTAFAGALGQDQAGEQVLRSMDGVEMSLVSRGGDTAVCLVVLERRARDRALVLSPASGLRFSLEEAAERVLREAGVVHLSSFVQDEGLELQQKVVVYMCKDQVLSFDPGEVYAAKGVDALKELLARTDMLFVTATELEMLFGMGEVEGGAALALEALAPSRGDWPIPMPVVVVKMGRAGASCYWRGGRVDAPANEVESVVDTTGAGDAFNAGFLHAVKKGRGIEEALAAGHAVASCAIADYGRLWMESTDWRLRLETLEKKWMQE